MENFSKFCITKELYQYMVDHSVKEHPLLAELRKETEKLHGGHMLTTAEQAQFLMLLISLLKPKNCLELGVFTGYSALFTALALENGAKLIACDLRDMHLEICQKYWKKAQVSDKIEFVKIPALELLNNFNNISQEFDYIYIDADKRGCMEYTQNAIPLLSRNGLLVVDNVFAMGKITDEADDTPATKVMRALNDHLMKRDDIHISIIPLGDGMTLIRKK